MKRVLCVEDLACVGRCSLAAALPVLSACGAQACCVPTGLFSTHTAGFGAPARMDTSAFAHAALAHYRALELSFDAVLSGYLADESQTALVREAFAQSPSALRVVDPAMADNGRLYSSLTQALCREMTGLCAGADVLLPNVTESELLLGLAPTGKAGSAADAAARCEALLAAFPRARLVIVTGWNGANVCAVRGAAPELLPFEPVETNYHGTGDVFAAAVTGLLLRGVTPREAICRTADLITRAARAAQDAGDEPRHGVRYESFLPLLADKGSETT